MAHEATVLEDGDTVYIGTLTKAGEYLEVRVGKSGDHLVVTHPGGSLVVGSQDMWGYRLGGHKHDIRCPAADGRPCNCGGEEEI